MNLCQEKYCSIAARGVGELRPEKNYDDLLLCELRLEKTNIIRIVHALMPRKPKQFVHRLDQTKLDRAIGVGMFQNCGIEILTCTKNVSNDMCNILCHMVCMNADVTSHHAISHANRHIDFGTCFIQGPMLEQ